MNDRLPEMLWAVLIAAAAPREAALTIFRQVAATVPRDAGHPFFPLTLTGIAGAPVPLREAFFERLLSAYPAARQALRPMLLLNELPGFDGWQAAIAQQPSDDDWLTLEGAVGRALNHQSELATDVRWVTVLTALWQGKIRMFSTMQDTVERLINYPNYGDESAARTSIRSTEMALQSSLSHSAASPWPAIFWNVCLTATGCVPLALPTDRQPAIGTTRARVRQTTIALVQHCGATRATSDIDARHDALFGGALYSLALLEELLGIGSSTSIAGRLVLRSILEVYITLTYLCRKADATLWSSYRVHGSGQAKLALLKVEEAASPPSSVSRETLHALANEDCWQEFLSIDVGHWAKSNLRGLAEAAGVKDEYDRIYSWTSTYTHGQWAAVRDAVFDTCGNPLHRLHRIPRESVRALPDALADAAELVDKTLALVAGTYAPFIERVRL